MAKRLEAAKKLTPKMEAVLLELSKPKCVAHYMQYMGRFNPNAYYFLSSNYNHCTAQITALQERGLAEIFNDKGFGDHQVRITAAGRKMVKELLAATEPTP